MAGKRGSQIIGAPNVPTLAPAVENAANAALVKFVAERLGVAKRSVRIVSGHASRRKVLEIDGVDAAVVADTFARSKD